MRELNGFFGLKTIHESDMLPKSPDLASSVPAAAALALAPLGLGSPVVLGPGVDGADERSLGNSPPNLQLELDDVEFVEVALDQPIAGAGETQTEGDAGGEKEDGEDTKAEDGAGADGNGAGDENKMAGGEGEEGERGEGFDRNIKAANIFKFHHGDDGEHVDLDRHGLLGKTQLKESFFTLRDLGGASKDVHQNSQRKLQAAKDLGASTSGGEATSTSMREVHQAGTSQSYSDFVTLLYSELS